MLELKETEYKELYKEEQEKDIENAEYVKDCVVETDSELRLPESYIENIAERMQLYRDLDNIEQEDQLKIFENNLIDRFGPIPDSGQRLFEIVRIRRMAKKLGIEKIILKNNLLYLYFVSNQESIFFQSPIFSKILMWLQNNPKKATMKEGKTKLYLMMKNINSIEEAKNIITEMNQAI